MQLCILPSRMALPPPRYRPCKMSIQRALGKGLEFRVKALEIGLRGSELGSMHRGRRSGAEKVFVEPEVEVWRVSHRH